MYIMNIYINLGTKSKHICKIIMDFILDFKLKKNNIPILIAGDFNTKSNPLPNLITLSLDNKPTFHRIINKK